MITGPAETHPRRGACALALQGAFYPLVSTGVQRTAVRVLSALQSIWYGSCLHNVEPKTRSCDRSGTIILCTLVTSGLANVACEMATPEQTRDSAHKSPLASGISAETERLLGCLLTPKESTSSTAGPVHKWKSRVHTAASTSTKSGSEHSGASLVGFSLLGSY